MEKHGNKTIMCSVLFLDIVEYSRKSVGEQISLKERFNSYLSTALGHVPVIDRIILDTGDGAAINFLGDVEDAFKVALSLRKSMLDENVRVSPPLLVRMGINHGPVRLVRDINGHPNIVGDGINVAQRVMSFADASQILVTRSYYEAVSRLSPTYAGMFQYQGARTDKHVREHDVYAICCSDDKTIPPAYQTSKQQSVLPAAEDNDTWKRAGYAGALVLVLLLIGVLVLRPSQHEEKPILPLAAPPASDLASAPAAPVSKSMSAVAGNTHVAKPESKAEGDTHSARPEKYAQSRPDAQVHVVTPNNAPVPRSAPSATTNLQVKPASGVANLPKVEGVKSKADQTRTAPAAQVAVPPRAVTTVATSSVATAADAYISLTCHEGTHLFVDGAQIGKVAGNKLKVAVPPGKHEIIVTGKADNFYKQGIDLGPGKTVNIKPDFCD